MKLRCKVCLGELTVEEGSPRQLNWPKGTSPYGGAYRHASTKNCPFLQALTLDELKVHPDVEVIE